MKNLCNMILLLATFVFSGAFTPGTLFSAVYLTQQNFESGTYRITVPDTYILEEDITFNPMVSAETFRLDKPTTGWFAAISVETDGVVLDLNNKTLQASQAFVDGHIFSLFAPIVLGNALLSDGSFVAFADDTSYVSANDCIVKDGVIGRSSSWGVHGTTNSNITIKNVLIKDFQFGGVALYGVVNSSIQDVTVTANDNLIVTTPLHSAAYTLINHLKSLAASEYPGAQAQLLALTSYVLDNFYLYNKAEMTASNTLYGILVAGGSDTTSQIGDHKEFFANGRIVDNLKIKNVHIEKLKHAPIESVLIGSSATGGIGFNLATIGLPVTGCGQWNDAFNKNGTFAPNPFLQAQLFAVMAQKVLNPSLVGALPPNFDAMAASILDSDEAAFLQETLPIFGRQVDNSQIKGTIGLCVDGAFNSLIENCTVGSLHNMAPRGAEVKNIAGGACFIDLLQQRYAGTDCWAFSLSNTERVIVAHNNANTISSENGNVYGLNLVGAGSDVVIKHFKAKNIYAFGGDTGSSVNMPSKVYGLNVQNAVGSIKIVKCRSQNITAPCFVFGFVAEACDNVRFKHCVAKDITVTSEEDLFSSRKALGVHLLSANNTLLKYLRIKNLHIKNKKSVGIYIDSSSKNSRIICPKIDHGRGDVLHNYGVNTQLRGCR